MFKIIGTLQGHREIINTAETFSDATIMKNEYQSAFGNNWVISIE